MKKPITLIRVTKSFAGVFFTSILTLSIYGIANLFLNKSLSLIALFGILLAAILGVALSVFGFFSLFSERFEYNPNSPAPKNKEPFITSTDSEIICEFPSLKKTEKVTWLEINLIQVQTTDQGPYTCDVFFILEDSIGGKVILPQDHEETSLVLKRMVDFPGFDYKTFVNAMGCTDNRLFRVWKKK